MTIDLAVDRTRRAGDRRPASNEGASYLAASGQVALRTIRKFIRTPALIIAGTAQGVLFLLIFRYVFGGAVAHTGRLSYVDFLVPGFVVTGVLFQGMGASSGVADDLQGGLFDRLRSLPIRLMSVVTGRVGADTALVAWGVVVMIAAGFAVGFRTTGSTAGACSWSPRRARRPRRTMVWAASPSLIRRAASAPRSANPAAAKNAS